MILIPMAGLSSRFFKAGYTKPKYMLEAHEKPLFDHAVLSFKYYFLTESFVFVVRADYDSASFVKQRCECLGIENYKVVILEHETKGQAETVAIALSKIEWKGALTIFNIDTFRPNFRFPPQTSSDGYLEVFFGEGDNWSFAKPEREGSDKVIKTAEKRPISKYCSTGLYYFSSVELFIEAYEKMLLVPENEWDSSELYVAPLYNFLIDKGADIRFHLIDKSDVIFCGVPEEYEDFMG